MGKVELIQSTINKIEKLIKEQLPESKYQFELFDLGTNSRHFRGLDEPFHWGSVYKLFVVAEIIKMAEEGLLNLDDELILHKEKYKNGSGILKFFSNDFKINYFDACMMVMSVSDNLCADELLDIVGFDRLNKFFKNENQRISFLNTNLNDLVSNLFISLPKYISSNFYHSERYFCELEKQLQIILQNNRTNANEVNTLFNLLNTNYFQLEASKKIFRNLLMANNQHSRISTYCYFSPIDFKGKTGTLGFSIINNETSMIFNKNNQNILGYFTYLIKNNKNRYFQTNDAVGVIGLEIASLYEELENLK